MANKMFDELDFLEIPTNMSALDPITYQYFNQLLNYRTVIMNAGVDDNLLESVIIPLRNFEILLCVYTDFIYKQIIYVYRYIYIHICV